MAMFVTVILSLAWLGIYALTEAHMIDKLVLLGSLVLATAIGTFVLKSFGRAANQGAPTASRKRWEGCEVPPPVDVAALVLDERGRRDHPQSRPVVDDDS